MAQLSTVFVGTMTVAVGTTTSNTIDETMIGDAQAITIYGPAALAGAASAVLEVQHTLDGSYYDLQSFTHDPSVPEDIAMPLVGKALSLADWGFRGMRIQTNAAVTGADAVWTVTKKILA